MNRTTRTIALLGALAITAATATAGAQDMHSGVYPAPNPKGVESTWTPSAEGSYVKSVIHDAGFTAISGMARGADGTWHAHAMKNNAAVDVTVDRSGRIATN
jgi:polyisoprenoid-binding protein YceI